MFCNVKQRLLQCLLAGTAKLGNLPLELGRHLVRGLVGSLAAIPKVGQHVNNIDDVGLARRLTDKRRIRTAGGLAAREYPTAGREYSAAAGEYSTAGALGGGDHLQKLLRIAQPGADFTGMLAKRLHGDLRRQV